MLPVRPFLCPGTHAQKVLGAFNQAQRPLANYAGILSRDRAMRLAQQPRVPMRVDVACGAGLFNQPLIQSGDATDRRVGSAFQRGTCGRVEDDPIARVDAGDTADTASVMAPYRTGRDGGIDIACVGAYQTSDG